jgi:hypothetical protein
MSNEGKPAWRLLGSGLAAVAVIATIAWLARDWGTRPAPPSNSIMVIAPYYSSGTWMFDDPSVGLRREPFVEGVPEMIDLLVKDIPNAKEGFRLLFSASPFPDYQKKLVRVRPSGSGNYYRFEDSSMEGWVCPAMFRYFKSPPESVYVKAEPIHK